MLKPPYHLGFHGSPLQILWRKKKEGENFEEKEEGMRGGRRKKERRAPSSGSWLRRCTQCWHGHDPDNGPAWAWYGTYLILAVRPDLLVVRLTGLLDREPT